MNTLYSINDYRSYELYHHGIRGQRWGRKMGPPYPLDASDHSSAEKKAGWKESLENSTRSRIKNATSAAKEERQIVKLSLSNKNLNEKQKAKLESLKDSYRKKVSDLSDKEIELGRRYYEENKAATTAAVIGGVLSGGVGALASYGVTKVANSVSSSGRETRRLRKEVEEENRTRLENARKKFEEYKTSEKSEATDSRQDYKTREEAVKAAQDEYKDRVASAGRAPTESAVRQAYKSADADYAKRMKEIDERYKR